MKYWVNIDASIYIDLSVCIYSLVHPSILRLHPQIAIAHQRSDIIIDMNSEFHMKN